MSQITRCPSCATMFKVVADQLRISDGWVRCGQCKEVFDASAHLMHLGPRVLLPDLPMTGATPLPKPVEHAADIGRAWGASQGVGPSMPGPGGAAFFVTEAAPASAAAMKPAPLSAADTDRALIAHVPETPLGTDELPQQATPVAPLDECPAGYELPAAELEDVPWFDESPMRGDISVAIAPDTPLQLLRQQAVEEAPASGCAGEHEGAQQHQERYEAQWHGPEQVSSSPPLDALASPDPVFSHSTSGAESGDELKEASPTAMLPQQEEYDPPQDALDGDEVSFVRAAKRKAFWRRPVVRAGLGLVAVLLLCALALQAVLQERDRIAAMDPRVRPWLQMLCEPFQCALAPLRKISEVVIDSSSFHKGRGDSYQLAFAIKNRASVPLATPAMELTLTDAQDQPVLRRVFLPSELAAPAEMPALGEWATSVAVIVTTGGARVAGYRLLAFYP